MPRDDDESPKMGEFETTRARWIEDDFERQALRGIRRRVGPEQGERRSPRQREDSRVRSESDGGGKEENDDNG